MKFRTDFVTNSSSTSYISVTIEYLDGRKHKLLDDSDDGTYAYMTLEVPEENKGKIIKKVKDMDDFYQAYMELHNFCIDDSWASAALYNFFKEVRPDLDIAKSIKINFFETNMNDYDDDEPNIYMDEILFDVQKEEVSYNSGYKKYNRYGD